jgi:hypothetical protein
MKAEFDVDKATLTKSDFDQLKCSIIRQVHFRQRYYVQIGILF